MHPSLQLQLFHHRQQLISTHAQGIISYTLLEACKVPVINVKYIECEELFPIPLWLLPTVL